MNKVNEGKFIVNNLLQHRFEVNDEMVYEMNHI